MIDYSANDGSVGTSLPKMEMAEEEMQRRR
jgi:hypothetical protein